MATLEVYSAGSADDRSYSVATGAWDGTATAATLAVQKALGDDDDPAIDIGFYVRFDITGVPGNAITYAFLRLTRYSGNNGTNLVPAVYSKLDSAHDQPVSGTEINGETLTTWYVDVPESSNGATIDLDVTSVVDEALDHGSYADDHIVFFVKRRTGGTIAGWSFYYHSGDAVTEADRPRLTIDYASGVSIDGEDVRTLTRVSQPDLTHKQQLTGNGVRTQARVSEPDMSATDVVGVPSNVRTLTRVSQPDAVRKRHPLTVDDVRTNVRVEQSSLALVPITGEHVRTLTRVSQPAISISTWQQEGRPRPRLFFRGGTLIG